MSCLIQLLEDQNELLRTQVKQAALSHDLRHAEIVSLKAELAKLREEIDPTPPMMTGSVLQDESEGEVHEEK